jgi:hypothetical protein
LEDIKDLVRLKDIAEKIMATIDKITPPTNKDTGAQTKAAVVIV